MPTFCLCDLHALSVDAAVVVVDVVVAAFVVAIVVVA